MALRHLIETENVAILDGGFGSSLDSLYGCLDPILFGSRAILDYPEHATDIHYKFLNAGADIITTSSYQCSIDGFAKVYPNFTTFDLVRTLDMSVQLAQSAIELYATRAETCRQSNRLIALSLGCYGAHIADGSEYNGNYRYIASVSKMKDFHREKFVSALNLPADIIAFETIACLDEVKAIVSLINEESNTINETVSNLELNQKHPTSTWISLACNSAHTLNSGELIEDALRIFEDTLDISQCKSLSVDVGVNCTPPAVVENIVDVMKESINHSRLIIAYPNKGETWDSLSQDWMPCSGFDDDEFCRLALKWYDAGANVIGGCCRCSHHTIECLSKVLRHK